MNIINDTAFQIWGTIVDKSSERFTQYPKIIKLWNKYRFTSPLFYSNFEQLRKIEPTLILSEPTYQTYNGTPDKEQAYIGNYIRDAIKEEECRCRLISMHTGKGKSHVMMQTADMLQGQILILAHNLKSKAELTEKFETYMPWFKNFKIITKALFVRINWAYLHLYEHILVDECHYWISKLFIEQVISMRENVKSLFGFSWTPITKAFNRNDIQKVFGRLIVMPWAQYQIPIVITQAKYKTPTQYLYADWATLKTEMSKDIIQFEAQARFVYETLKKHALVFFDRIEDVNTFSQTFARMYWAPASITQHIITGETKVVDDAEWLSSLKDKQKTITICTIAKMGTAIDVPILSEAYLFAPVKFESSVIQAVWRILRTYPWKEHGIFYDWCYLPHLRNQMYERKKAYTSEYKDQLTINSLTIL